MQDDAGRTMSSLRHQKCGTGKCGTAFSGPAFSVDSCGCLFLVEIRKWNLIVTIVVLEKISLMSNIYNMVTDTKLDTMELEVD